MDIDEDTDWWLGSPTPLEMCHQHALLLENEIQELNLHLRKAREDIFGLTKMLADAEAVKSEYRGYLAERGAEVAAMRKQIDSLGMSARASEREVERLRQMLVNLVPQPKTIV